MHVRVALLPGDGIGVEVTNAATRVLDAVGREFGHQFEYTSDLIGGSAIDAAGTALPAETVAACQAADAVLLGAVGGPQWDNPKASVRPEQGLLGLRAALGVFANLRPVRVHPSLADATPLKASLVAGVDLMVVRELTGGIYFGQPQGRSDGPQGRAAVDTLNYNETEVRRCLDVAYHLARQRRRKVTQVDKANVLASSRLWREVHHEVAAHHPDVRHEDVLVDAMAMHLIRRPADFDVIVTENLFGDILTDEAAVLAGSLGMLPSASIGEAHNRHRHPRGLYEPVHGSAPDIAGRGIANPLGAILSVGLLLHHSLGLTTEAAAVENAVDRVLTAGYRTPDLASGEGTQTLGTTEMTDAVIARLH
ncbi:MAG: 3-isopropylmalate dehydrogenase [Anaerolineae bacterium]|nr:3-isopropylmalate dehydrogenase [Anaerolineae bacterium]